jgi:hypothetical protein
MQVFLRGFCFFLDVGDIFIRWSWIDKFAEGFGRGKHEHNHMAPSVPVHRINPSLDILKLSSPEELQQKFGTVSSI